MEKKTIGSFIAALRKAHGLTQRQLAEKLNVSDKAVSRWERDESAPDLTLIPVIAEIFGITSDELLRGERATEAASPERNAVKTEKQIRYVLSRTQTLYTILCIVTLCIAVVGLIAAMIANYGFLAAITGFFAACVLFVIAAACQAAFMVWAFHKLGRDDFPPEVTAPLRRRIILGGQLCYGVLAVLFAGCLPLVLLVRDAHWGLRFGSWTLQGGICAAVVGLVWFGVCAAVNIRKGWWHMPDLKSPVNRLRLRWLGKGICILLAVAVLHMVSVSLLSQNYHLFIGGRKFDDWDSFRRYMETPTDTDGTPLTFQALEGTGDNTRYIYEDQDGDAVVFRKETVSQRIYATVEDEEAGNDPLVRYRHLNKNISSIKLNRGGLPVQVFTQLQMKIVTIITACVHLLWCAVYFLSIRKVLRSYRAEKAKL